MPKEIVYVRGIRLEVDSGRLGPLELPGVVSMIEQKMKDISAKTGIIDSLQLPYLAAMEFASELYLKGHANSMKNMEEETAVDEMIHQLQTSLNGSLLD